MLNLVTPRIADQHLLEDSYNAIQQRECLSIITDGSEKQTVLRQTIDAIKIPVAAQFSLQNLFRITKPGGTFYIAQCLADFNYPATHRGAQTFDHKYQYCIIGIANTRVDFGITNLRPETKMNNYLYNWLDKDVDFPGSQKFSDKYYLQTNSKETIVQYFDKPFIDAIAKYTGILLTTNQKEIYIAFNRPLQVDQSRVVEEIFSQCQFLQT